MDVSALDDLNKKLTAVENVLWLLRNVLMVALLLRLVLIKALGRYPMLAGFLLFSVLRSAALFVFRYGTTPYGTVYFFTAPLLWLAYGAVCWELYGEVFEQYHSISLLSRRSLVTVLVCCFAVAIVSAARDMNTQWQKLPVLLAGYLSSRIVYSAFFLYLVVLIGFLLWFRIPLRRNVIVNAVAFTFYFFALSVTALFLDVAGAPVLRAVNTLMLALLDFCLLAWVLAVASQGEELRSQLGRRPDPAHQQQLLASLEGLNRMAATAMKKL